MTLAEFEDLIERLGEDLATWPSEQAAQALELLEVSPEARAIRRKARALRRAFDAAPTPQASAALVDRILAQAAVTPQIDSPPADPPPKAAAPASPPAQPSRKPPRRALRDMPGMLALTFSPALGLALAACFAGGLLISAHVGAQPVRIGLLEEPGSILDLR